MTNPYYNGGGFPATGSPATSASMRAELSSITAGFDKLPTLSGNANKLIAVNGSGTALEPTTSAPSLTVDDATFLVQDNSDNTKKFRFEVGGITTATTRVLTVPDADLTLVGIDTTQTLTNKTLASPVYTGTLTGGTGIVNIGSGQIYKASGGNFGLGTTSPSYRLDAQGATNSLFGARLYNSNNGASASTLLQLGNDVNGAAAAVILYSSTNTTGVGGANALSIIQGLNAPLVLATSSATRLSISGSGAINIPDLTASTALALDGSKNIVSVTNTGSGSNVLATSPTLVTPVLGTPTSGTLTNCTGLPISSGVSGLGTGVATALAVNTGTAGAFIVNGGALGTPSSGTVTNLTGTASININGTVGATTPNTGAFTSVVSTSAAGILTRAAATQDGVELIGRAGGTSSFKVTFTPTTLSASRTLTLPDNSGTLLTTGAAVTVPQGGTGLTSGTSGGVPYFSASNTIASSAALAANALVVGGGAGVAPSTITTGTGVTTALGVAVGSAGAFVVNGGALGTPSSGILTNATGLPLSTGVTGTLSVGNGGTGATSLTGVLKGNGTGAFTAGSVSLTSEVTGTLPVANGGTGIIAFGTGVATALGQNVTGSGSIVLSSSPTLTTPNLGTPSALTLTNATGLPLSTGVTGTLGGANGGTGTTSFGAANRVPYASSTTALTNSAILTFDGSTLTVDGIAVSTRGKGVGTTAIGNGALATSGTQFDNTAIGYSALYSVNTGSTNTGVGNQAGFSTSSGYDNTFVGFWAGKNVSAGHSNIVIGSSAGNAITTGAANIIVGTSSNASSGTSTNEYVFGHSITGQGNNTAYIGGTNGAYNQKNVTTWQTVSDARIKKNVSDNSDGLGVIKQIKVRNFEYREEDEIVDLPKNVAIRKAGVQLGVIAQEFQQVLPECVTENSTGVLSVNTDPLIWHLVNAIKELSAEIEALKAQ